MAGLQGQPYPIANKQLLRALSDRSPRPAEEEEECARVLQRPAEQQRPSARGQRRAARVLRLHTAGCGLRAAQKGLDHRDTKRSWLPLSIALVHEALNVIFSLFEWSPCFKALRDGVRILSQLPARGAERQCKHAKGLRRLNGREIYPWRHCLQR